MAAFGTPLRIRSRTPASYGVANTVVALDNSASATTATPSGGPAVVLRAYQLQLSEWHVGENDEAEVCDTSGDPIVVFASTNKQTNFKGKVVVEAGGIEATGLDIGADGSEVGDIYSDGFVDLVDSGDPTYIANSSMLYSKSGELYARTTSGIYQLTSSTGIPQVIDTSGYTTTGLTGGEPVGFSADNTLTAVNGGSGGNGLSVVGIFVAGGGLIARGPATVDKRSGDTWVAGDFLWLSPDGDELTNDDTLFAAGDVLIPMGTVISAAGAGVTTATAFIRRGLATDYT